MALKCGIDAVLYDTISYARIKYPHFELEKLRYKDTASELYSLCVYALACFGNIYKGDEGFWYRYGLSVLGALCTGASEWVWETLHKENIHQIFPVMREGKFLWKLVENTKKYHNDAQLRIKPLYISRKAVYLPSMNNPAPKDILYVCMSNGIRIKDLYYIL